MKKYIDRSKEWLLEGVDPHVLSLFRIIYGLFMTYEMINYIQIWLIRNMFFLPAINFKYDFLAWLTPLPEKGMDILLYVLLACAIAITAGIMFKWACRLFAVGYLYIFLLDKSIYNNHIYLFILLAFLLSFTNADRWISLRKKPKDITLVPRWQQFIVQLQIMIVYFYGGIAKITFDWLFRGQPVRTLLDQMNPDLWLAPLVKNEFGVHLLTYVGFLIDIGAPFLLWYKPVRRWAIYPFIIFHFSNSNIFSDIGIFPYIMMLSLVIYFETNEIPFFRKLFKRDLGSTQILAGDSQPREGKFATTALTSYVLVGYFTFQFLFPFRGHFLPNDLDWTTIGNRFSWRMKVDTRVVEEMNFTVYDAKSGQDYPVNIRTMVNEMQMLNMSLDPRSVAQFGRLLKSNALKNGISDPLVKTRLRVRYNGRPSQFIIDPEADISTVTYSFAKKLDWVIPVNK